MAAKYDVLPFNEAIDFFKQKIQLPSAAWTDIWQEQHSLAFVVAGAQKDALVADFYGAMKKAMSEGTGYAEFKKDFDQIVKTHGWAHKGDAGWRSKIIYDTNMSQAYNAGRYQQQWDLRELRPYWQYVHTSWNHPRLEHKAWNGLILRADDPWWGTHYPQNGWGCKCKINSLSRDGAKSAWEQLNKKGPDKAPPMDWEERVVGKNTNQPRTVLTPKGIDPGFSYNPGKAYLEGHTVPPLTGYDAVTDWRGKQGFSIPDALSPVAPARKRIANARILPASAFIAPPYDTLTEVSKFLEVFGATLDQESVFYDAAQVPVLISKALFIKGGDKAADNFKWLADERKAGRIPYLNLLALTIAEPDEVWWRWEAMAQSKDEIKAGKPKEWILKRRYIKAFRVDGKDEFAISAFTWGKSGWSGSTVFPAKDSIVKTAEQYFDDQRRGRLVWQRQ